MDLPKPSTIIDASWQLYLKEFRTLLPLIILSLIPGIIGLGLAGLPRDTTTLLLTMLVVVVYAWVEGGMTHVLGNIVLKRPAGVKDSLTRALSRLGIIFGLMFITQFFTAVGVVAFIIPGIFLGYIFSFAMPSLVLGEKNIWPSLMQSYRLAMTKPLLQTINAVVGPWLFWQLVIFLTSGILVMLVGALERIAPGIAFGYPLATARTLPFVILCIASFARPIVIACRVMVYVALHHVEERTTSTESPHL